MSVDKGKPNDWATRHAATDDAAKTIIGEETSVRDAKTARLKALREARVVPAEPPPKSKTRTKRRP